MTDEYSRIDRRRFLTATGAAGVTGVAGCSALTGDDGTDESTTDSNGDAPADNGTETPDLDDPAAVVTSLLEAMESNHQTLGELQHNEIHRSLEIENIDVEVLDEDLSEDKFAAITRTDESLARSIATEAETALAEATYDFIEDTGTEEAAQNFALATENGAWKIVEADVTDAQIDGSEEHEPPAVVYDAEFKMTEGEVTSVTISILTADGAADAQNIYIRGSAIAGEHIWSEFEGGEEIIAGESITIGEDDAEDRLIDAPEGEEIILVYETDHGSAVQDTFRVPER